MNAAQKRFAADYGMTEEEVARLVRTAHVACDANEHACNGDPHPDAKGSNDKNRCMELWQGELDILTELIRDIVAPHGFTGIVYNGIYPTLKRGDQFIEIPC